MDPWVWIFHPVYISNSFDKELEQIIYEVLSDEGEHAW